MGSDGVGQVLAILRQVQAQRWSGNDLQIKGAERDAGSRADAVGTVP